MYHYITINGRFVWATNISDLGAECIWGSYSKQNAIDQARAMREDMGLDAQVTEESTATRLLDPRSLPLDHPRIVVVDGNDYRPQLHAAGDSWMRWNDTCALDDAADLARGEKAFRSVNPDV